ncbi:Retinoblastoma-related protein [Camellia lanceoleosa]|uniref:Retinoblastoma-related protein n=1 Tax=Camellia lanceoleosa TaxID=1840588 RepID=A0ACC0GRQ0_9ERIC|nr:Retinoblastoma-related protein [Camellia lanceoleosa]
MPDNLVKNVALIREINSNISKVISLYSDLFVDFSNIVQQRRAINNDDHVEKSAGGVVCLNILENDYADATRNKSELDERVFVNKEDSLLGSGSSSGGAMNISGAKRKIDSIASPTRTSISPLAPYCSPSASHAKTIPCGSNSKVKATPITTAMTTAKVGSSHCCYQLGRLCT